jgi:hypothetical protein
LFNGFIRPKPSSTGLCFSEYCHYSWFRIVRRQVIATKRALGDLWQLAFSYEVNPLAAVQPLAAAAHQGQ